MESKWKLFELINVANTLMIALCHYPLSSKPQSLVARLKIREQAEIKLFLDQLKKEDQAAYHFAHSKAPKNNPYQVTSHN